MLSLSRIQAYGLVSTTIFVSTVINAFRQRSNFYAAAVYLSKSNACMMVSALLPSLQTLNAEMKSVTSLFNVFSLSSLQILWNQAIYQTVLFGKLLQIIFFGELRLIEVEVSSPSPRTLRVEPKEADNSPVARIQ
jgi:E3 ubiquitin-protein ligase synoviolin